MPRNLGFNTPLVIVFVTNSHGHAGTTIVVYGQIIFSAMLDLFITHPIRSRSAFWWRSPFQPSTLGIFPIQETLVFVRYLWVL